MFIPIYFKKFKKLRKLGIEGNEFEKNKNIKLYEDLFIHKRLKLKEICFRRIINDEINIFDFNIPKHLVDKIDRKKMCFKCKKYYISSYYQCIYNGTIFLNQICPILVQVCSKNCFLMINE